MFLRVCLSMASVSSSLVNSEVLERRKAVSTLLKVKEWGAAQTVIDRYRTIPVIVVRPCMLVRLLATRIHQVLLTAPVIFVGRGVDVGRQVLIVIGGEDQVEPFGQQVAFVVFERWHQRMAFPVLLAVDRILAYAGLYLLVHVRIGEAQ